MAEKVYFLNVEDWEQYGFTNTNIDVKKLRVISYRAQFTHIRSVLGTTLYDKIVSEITAGTLTGIYQTLMDDYVVDTLVAWCDYKATFHTTNQIMNKTTGKNSDEHIDSNDLDDNNALRNTLRADAKQFESDMIGWLQDNRNNIPEYCNTPEDQSHQTIHPSQIVNDYFGNIGVI